MKKAAVPSILVAVVLLAVAVIALRAKKGDIEKGFGESDKIFEHRFQTQMVHQGYIEPYACSVEIDAEGRILAWASTQSPFSARDQMACFQAQQPAREVPRIGILFIGDRNQPHLEAFKQGLRERGYIEGKNIAIEYRYAEGKINRLPLLAAELVKLKVDVIVTTADTGARTARQATKTTPIVLTTGADLVKSGLAESLAKPGGNVTGLSVLEEDLSGKRLDILKEAFPKMSRVAYLWNPSAVPYSLEHGATTTANPSFDQAKAIAQAVGLQLRSYEVYTLAEIEKAFADMSKARPDALFVILSPLMTLNSERIVELALEQRLPGMYPTNQFAEEGGLMTYGPRIGDMYRRAATYVDKILKGAKAGDLPIEQPTKFEFVINLKTAKQIGVTIPPNVLARADKVIK